MLAQTQIIQVGSISLQCSRDYNYFNAKQLIEVRNRDKTEGKFRWVDFKKTKNAQEVIKSLLHLQVQPYNTQRGGGTFVHRVLAIELAGWCSKALQTQLLLALDAYLIAQSSAAASPTNTSINSASAEEVELSKEKEKKLKRKVEHLEERLEKTTEERDKLREQAQQRVVRAKCAAIGELKKRVSSLEKSEQELQAEKTALQAENTALSQALEKKDVEEAKLKDCIEQALEKFQRLQRENEENKRRLDAFAGMSETDSLPDVKRQAAAALEGEARQLAAVQLLQQEMQRVQKEKEQLILEKQQLQAELDKRVGTITQQQQWELDMSESTRKAKEVDLQLAKVKALDAIQTHK